MHRQLSEDYADKVIVTTIQKLGLALDENSKRNKQRKKNDPLTYKQQLDDSSVSTPLQLWYEGNLGDVPAFEKQMRRKVHYVIEPQHLWNSIAAMARTQSGELLSTLQDGLNTLRLNR